MNTQETVRAALVEATRTAHRVRLRVSGTLVAVGSTISFVALFVLLPLFSMDLIPGKEVNTISMVVPGVLCMLMGLLPTDQRIVPRVGVAFATLLSAIMIGAFLCAQMPRVKPSFTDRP